MKKFEVELKWQEEHKGKIKVEAKNIDEAKDKVRNNMDLGYAVEECWENGTEDFVSLNYDSIKFNIKEGE